MRRKYIIHNYIDPKQSTDEHAVMVSGENYTKLINKSMASASLVAAIIYKKYVMGMPLYRIETDFNRKNILITRQDRSNWLTICIDKYLKYLFEQMRQDLLKEDILYGDETTVNCLEEKDRDKSYMWIQRTSPTSDRQISLYYYNASREYGFAKEIYAGFKGYLHADAYGAYTKLDDVTVAACWAHARRYVFEALESYQIDKTFKRCHSRQERADLLAANKAYAKTLELFNLIEDLFKADKKITGSTKDYDEIKVRRLNIFIISTKGLSPNTQRSYKQTFRLLFQFLYEEVGLNPDGIRFKTLTTALLSDYLDWLENTRKCSVSTRNQQLFSIYSDAFF